MIPKVTVYMPNFNYSMYIEQAVNSIINQTLSDWELIVIDDGSQDNSLKLLEKYKIDNRITIISQENKGLNVTNNVAIRLARGEYIVRVDSDDYLEENFLLILANMLDSNPKIGLAFPDYHNIDKDGNILETIRRKKIGVESELLDLPAHGACTMFRLDILKNIGSYNEEFSCQDGFDIWLRFIEKHQPGNVNLPLFYYRQHNASLTKNEQKILDTRRAINRKYVDNKGGIKNKLACFIPIQTKSIYHQNRPFVELAGKPLIWYTLSEAIKIKCFDEIIVSCSDEEVLKYVNKNFPNIKALKRKFDDDRNELSMPFLIKNSLKELDSLHLQDNDAVCMLPISTPLRKAKHIEHAIDAMEIFDVDTVISIEEEFSPCYNHGKFGLKPINIKSQLEHRLERDSIFRDNSAILLSKIKQINLGEMIGKKVGHITMLPEESIKLNSDFEFFIAEKILNSQ